MSRAMPEVAPVAQGGAIRIRGIDYVEMYVGNPYQASHFYRTLLGFRPVAYAGLETGLRDRSSIVMQQGEIRLLLTGALGPDGPVAEHVHLHGDGVRDVAFSVDDAAQAFEIALKRGARAVLEPTEYDGPEGHVIRSTIGAFGDTVHSFVQRESSGVGVSPEFRTIEKAPPVAPTGLIDIDHVAVGMEEGALDEWVGFYTRVLGFRKSREEMVWTKGGAMNSKVVEDSSGRIKLPILEPVRQKGRSQIDEYLSYYHGVGTQHVALLTSDIVATVRSARANGAEFLSVPRTYYEELTNRVGPLDDDLATGVEEQSILVDRDEHGLLFQIFTRPLQSRPTLFFEIVERRGATGFGSGNIRALFEALEREQARRGNT